MKNSQTKGKNGGRKVTVFDTTFMEGRRAPRIITQARLALVQQIQSSLAYYQEELKREWGQVRKDMVHGVPVEPGPIRVFLRKVKGGYTIVIK